MSKKAIIVTVSTMAALFLMLVLVIRDALTNLDVNVQFDSVDANIDSIADIGNLLEGQKAITLKFLVGITNTNWFRIPIRDLETRVFYRGQLIGNSSPDALKDININAGSYQQWIEPVDLRADKALIKQLFNEIFSGSDPIIRYETELKVWGIRYTYSDQIQLIKTALS